MSKKSSNSSPIVVAPQPGAQEQFINMPPEVDIVFYGGAAG
jgi:hypothetical protein